MMMFFLEVYLLILALLLVYSFSFVPEIENPEFLLFVLTQTYI